MCLVEVFCLYECYVVLLQYDNFYYSFATKVYMKHFLRLFLLFFTSFAFSSQSTGVSVVKSNTAMVHAVKAKESRGHVGSRRSGIIKIDEKKVLQKNLSKLNQQWVCLNNRKFIAYKSQAALQKFQNLPSLEQWESAKSAALIPVGSRVVEDCTPQGIINYWRDQQNYENQNFKQLKNTQMAVINLKRWKVVHQLRQVIESEQLKKESIGRVGECVNPLTKSDRKKQLKMKNICLHRALVSTKKMQKKTLEVEQIKKKEQRRKNKELQADLERERVHLQRIRDKEIYALRKKQEEIDRQVEEQESILRQDDLERERAEEQCRRDEAKYALRKNKEEAIVRDQQLLHSMQLASADANHKKEADDLFKSSMASGSSLAPVSKSFKAIPFKEKLDSETYEYGSSLIISNGSDCYEKNKKMIVEFKQKQELRLQTRLDEYDEIAIILGKYEALLATEYGINMPELSFVMNQLEEKNKELVANEDCGLTRLIACDSNFFIRISRHLIRQQYTFQNRNEVIAPLDIKIVQLESMLENPALFKSRKAIQEKLILMKKNKTSLEENGNLSELLASVKEIQGDKGILNPSLWLSESVMEVLNSSAKK